MATGGFEKVVKSVFGGSVLTLKVRGEGQLARTYEYVILRQKIPTKYDFGRMEINFI